MISNTTIKKAFWRCLKFAIGGGIAAMALVPVSLDGDFNKYLVSLGIALLSGFLGGLHKAIMGYMKYDLKR